MSYLVLTTIVEVLDEPGAGKVFEAVARFHQELAEQFKVVTPAPPQWRVRYPVVNVRVGPSAETAKMGEVYQGEVLTAIGAAPGWVQIDRGWVSADLLEPV